MKNIRINEAENRLKLASNLVKSMGYTFKNSDLLEEAITHSSSVAQKCGGVLVSNERLEFLGDSVPGLVASGHLTGPLFIECLLWHCFIKKFKDCYFSC